MGERIRLHLGAGDRHWPTWTSVDIAGEPDILSDVRRLEMDNGSVDEIAAIHLFEHLERGDVENTLREWHRVLRDNGKLTLEMPCLDKIIGLWNHGHRSEGMIGRALFGMSEPAAMQHKWCYSKDEIADLLKTAGFRDVEVTDALFHVPNRDMRVVGYK